MKELRRSSRIFTFTVFVAFVVPIAAQVATSSKTRAHVETLASEKFGGREAGSDGERLAADYIAAQLTRLGARPLLVQSPIGKLEVVVYRPPQAGGGRPAP